MKGFLAFPVLLFLLFGTPASADYQKGLDAANRGDYATALKEWEPLADQGYADAQYQLGVAYDLGHGVTQDYKVAVKWWERAAEQGVAAAQYNLGNMYYDGQGVTKDNKAAFKWYKLAAEQGYVIAQYNMGLMYAYGEGVYQDYTRAYMWWHFAALQGYENAARNRSKVKYEMTPSQIEKAQELTRECVAKNYKDC